MNSDEDTQGITPNEKHTLSSLAGFPNEDLLKTSHFKPVQLA